MEKLLTVGAIWIETGKPEQAATLADELTDFQVHVHSRGSKPGVEVAVDRELNSLLVDLIAATERWLMREDSEEVSLQIGERTYRLPPPPRRAGKD
jgi:hypothetical protein